MQRIGAVLVLMVLTATVVGGVPAESRIVAVTLFPDTATVLREATVRLEAGERTVRFGGLPRWLEGDSAMARGVGTDGILILDTMVKQAFAEQGKGAEEARLDDAIKLVEKEKKALETEKGLVEARIGFLEQLKVASITDINTKIKIRTIRVEEWNKLYSFIFDRMGTLRSRELQLAGKQADLEKRLAKLRNRRANLDKQAYKKETIARVAVRVKRAGVYRIRLEYRVRRTGWRPGYEVRLAADGKTAETTYFATIRQQTGEDWSGVRLELATAAAGRWKRLPEQAPWLLYPGTRYRYRGAPSGSGRSMSRSEDRAAAPSAASKGYSSPYRDVARSRLITGGVAVRFSVHGLASVPSGTGAVRRVLQVLSLPVELAYKAFPNYAPRVFVEGTVKNTSRVHFLPGAVRVFREGAQIGRTSMAGVAPGGSFRLFFGNDPGVETKKELLERKMDPGSDNELFYTFQLTVHNNSDRRRVVTLFDALPSSTNTKIEVDIKEMSLQPNTRSKQGVCQWKLTLGPGEKKTIRYRVKVEYPSKTGITGLR